MVLSEERRNEIAWQYLLVRIQKTDLLYTNFDSPETRQRIRVTSEELDISFEESLAFVYDLLTIAWYEKAAKSLKSILHKLDEDLVVKVVPLEVDDAIQISLCFSHRTDPNIKWAMEITESDEFIEDELPQQVELYFRGEHGG